MTLRDTSTEVFLIECRESKLETWGQQLALNGISITVTSAVDFEALLQRSVGVRGVMVVDVDLFLSRCLEVVGQWSHAEWVVLCGPSDAAVARKAIALGARACVTETDPSGSLACAVESVISGGVFISPTLMADVVACRMTAEARAHAQVLACLQPFEMRVLELLSRGASNAEIVGTIGITLPTVKKTVSKLLDRFGAGSRCELVVRVRAASGYFDWIDSRV